MKIRKQYLVLFLVGAFLLGIVGTYTGMKLVNNHQTDQLAQDKMDDNHDDLNKPKDMQKIVQAYNLIKVNYLRDVKDKELVEGAISGMLKTLDDPYSTYMDADTMKQFNETIESSFQGIGAQVSTDDNKVTIIAPIKDSPAEKAGLRPKDHILKVDDTSVVGMDLTKAVEKIRGKKGSDVVLEIERPGVANPFNVTVTRDDIPIKTVHQKLEKKNGKKTGIIEITTFSENTAEEFTDALANLEEKGMEGLIIDVRGNPGGLLKVVQDILKQFIPEDMPMVQLEDGKGNKQPFYSNLKEKKAYPISVLVNEGSASAAEILAIAMKEAGYDIVGTKSFGKGTAQQATPMGDGSTIKLTYAKWLSPGGKWINKKGVKPTIKVKQPAFYYANPIDVKDKPLKFDHTGDKVKNVQIMLKGIGYHPNREDGYFSKQTVKAVKAFQRDADLKITGQVDEKTIGAIETKLMENIRSGKSDRQMKTALKHLYKN